MADTPNNLIHALHVPAFAEEHGADDREVAVTMLRMSVEHLVETGGRNATVDALVAVIHQVAGGHRPEFDLRAASTKGSA